MLAVLRDLILARRCPSMGVITFHVCVCVCMYVSYSDCFSFLMVAFCVQFHSAHLVRIFVDISSCLFGYRVQFHYTRLVRVFVDISSCFVLSSIGYCPDSSSFFLHCSGLWSLTCMDIIIVALCLFLVMSVCVQHLFVYHLCCYSIASTIRRRV